MGRQGEERLGKDQDQAKKGQGEGQGVVRI